MSEKSMLGGALAEVAGPLKDFAEKLGGEEGEIWLVAFKRFLRKENPWPKFPVWKTIKLGLHKSTPEYHDALEKGEYHINDYTSQIFCKIPINQEEVEVDLVLVTGRQFGLMANERYDVIYDLALKCGLQRCPAEVGPALRLQYNDQPDGELIIIAMEPILAYDRSPLVFELTHYDSVLRLDGTGGYPHRVCFPDSRWLFVRPRK